MRMETLNLQSDKALCEAVAQYAKHAKDLTGKGPDDGFPILSNSNCGKQDAEKITSGFVADVQNVVAQLPALVLRFETKVEKLEKQMASTLKGDPVHFFKQLKSNRQQKVSLVVALYQYNHFADVCPGWPGKLARYVLKEGRDLTVVSSLLSYDAEEDVLKNRILNLLIPAGLLSWISLNDLIMGVKSVIMVRELYKKIQYFNARILLTDHVMASVSECAQLKLTHKFAAWEGAFRGYILIQKSILNKDRFKEGAMTAISFVFGTLSLISFAAGFMGGIGVLAHILTGKAIAAQKGIVKAFVGGINSVWSNISLQVGAFSRRNRQWSEFRGGLLCSCSTACWIRRQSSLPGAVLFETVVTFSLRCGTCLCTERRKIIPTRNCDAGRHVFNRFFPV